MCGFYLVFSQNFFKISFKVQYAKGESYVSKVSQSFKIKALEETFYYLQDLKFGPAIDFNLLSNLTEAALNLSLQQNIRSFRKKILKFGVIRELCEK